MTRYALHVLVRSAALVVVSICFQQGWITASDDPLGQGLTAFAVLAGLAGVWGAVDGWRWATSDVLVVWLLTGLVVAVATARTDLLTITFLAALVAGPGVFAGAVTSQVKTVR